MDEIDLDEELSSGLLTEGTQKSYSVYLRKFAAFYHFEYDGNVVPNEYLTDENMATFFVKLYKEHGYKPYIKKTACAAFGYCLRFHGRPTLAESPHTYPWVSKALDKWAVELKKAPYFPTSASNFSVEAIAEILSLDCSSKQDYQDKCFAAITIFTGMRLQDVWNVKCTGISKVARSRDSPRRYRMILDKTKTDPLGTGPVEGRTFILPCTCEHSLLSCVDEREKFISNQEQDPFCKCCRPCPFQIMTDYLALIPDASGVQRATIMSGIPNTDLKALKLMRAQNHTGNDDFTLGPLGENSMRKIMKRINGRLSSGVQVSKPTGHSGRHTLSSVAMNEGHCDAVSVSKSTKHKDPKILRNYIHASDNVLMSAGLSIGDVVSRQSSCDNTASVSPVDESSHLSSISGGARSGSKRQVTHIMSNQDESDENVQDKKKKGDIVFNIYC